MDEGILTIIYYLIPIIITVICIYFTLKLSYSRRFLPSLLLIVLAVVLFFIGQFVRPFNNPDTNFEFALSFIYFGVTLVVGGVIALISAVFRKRKA